MKVALHDAMVQTGCFNCIAELDEADYLIDPAFTKSPEAKRFFDNNGCGLEPFDPDGNVNDGGMLVPYYASNIVATTNRRPMGDAFMQRWAIVEMKHLKPQDQAKTVRARYEALLDDPAERGVYAVLYSEGYKEFALKICEVLDVRAMIEQARGLDRTPRASASSRKCCGRSSSKSWGRCSRSRKTIRPEARWRTESAP
jgi:hypothetical protein